MGSSEYSGRNNYPVPISHSMHIYVSRVLHNVTEEGCCIIADRAGHWTRWTISHRSPAVARLKNFDNAITHSNAVVCNNKTAINYYKSLK